MSLTMFASTSYMPLLIKVLSVALGLESSVRI